MTFLKLSILVGAYIFSLTSAKAVEPVTVGIASVAVSATVSAKLCVSDEGAINTNRGMVGCGGLITTSAPVITLQYILGMASDVIFKEEIQQIEVDAYNFLAGEEISLALEEQMAKVREAAPELADLSDEEIVTIMIEIANR